MPAKYERCVKEVQKSQQKRYGKQKYNAYAVCHKTLNAKKQNTMVLKFVDAVLGGLGKVTKLSPYGKATQKDIKRELRKSR